MIGKILSQPPPLGHKGHVEGPSVRRTGHRQQMDGHRKVGIFCQRSLTLVTPLTPRAEERNGETDICYMEEAKQHGDIEGRVSSHIFVTIETVNAVWVCITITEDAPPSAAEA